MRVLRKLKLKKVKYSTQAQNNLIFGQNQSFRVWQKLKNSTSTILSIYKLKSKKKIIFFFKKYSQTTDFLTKIQNFGPLKSPKSLKNELLQENHIPFYSKVLIINCIYTKLAKLRTRGHEKSWSTCILSHFRPKMT